MARIKIPLEVVAIDQSSYHIFISVIINDVKRDIIIDTGASRTVFDMECMSGQPVDIDADEIISLGLGQGNIDTLAGILMNFVIGEHSWQKVSAIFMDLSHINEMYKKMSKKQISGLIGGDFLHSTKAVINYQKAEITFTLSKKKKNIFG